jgi:hypothetical protein
VSFSGPLSSFFLQLTTTFNPFFLKDDYELIYFKFLTQRAQPKKKFRQVPQAKKYIIPDEFNKTQNHEI